MTHLLVIAIMVLTTVREMAPEPLTTRAWVLDHPAQAAGWALGPFVALALVQLAIAWRTLRRLGSPDGTRWWRRFERCSSLVRVGALFAHAWALLVFGLLDLVRAWLGDLIGIDELIVLIPPIGILLLTWASAAPIETRLREALLIRQLDQGLRIPPMPRPIVWWWSIVKQQMLFVAVPIGLMLLWSEIINRLHDGLWLAAQQRISQSTTTELGSTLGRVLGLDGTRLGESGSWKIDELFGLGHAQPVVDSAPGWAQHAPAWLLNESVLVYGSAGLQLIGVLMLLALMPIALRVLWDTHPLGPGAMRDRLMELCTRYRVGVRKILLWRTQGGMINGAIIGFVPRLRYILLTDTLFSALPLEQIEAVTAHEVAHARCRHIPWLAGSMLGSAILVTAIVSFIMRASSVGVVTEGWAPVVVLGAAVLVGLVVFGWVSRIFEKQADAFAAKHMNTRDRLDTATTSVRTFASYGPRVMAQALGTVTRINGHPAEKFTWRHGSILSRQKALLEAIDTPLDRLPADRAARRAKRVVLMLLLAGFVLSGLDARAEASRRPIQDTPLNTTSHKLPSLFIHTLPHVDITGVSEQ